MPFAPEERWLVLGGVTEAEGRGPAAIRGGPDAHLRHGHVPGPAAGRPGPERAPAHQWRRLNQPARYRGGGDAPVVIAPVVWPSEPSGRDELGPWQATVEIAQIGRWLEEFHPHSVVELDYGGLVHLLDDDSLRADQSVAEVSAAISASREGQQDLAGVLYQRLRSRWQGLESLEAAN